MHDMISHILICFVPTCLTNLQIPMNSPMHDFTLANCVHVACSLSTESAPSGICRTALDVDLCAVASVQ